MNEKIKKINRHELAVATIILFLFGLGLALGAPARYLAPAEMGIALLLWVIFRNTERRRNKELVQYIESVTYQSEAAQNNTMMNFPLPMVVYLLDSNRIVWGNQEFFSICGRKKPAVNVAITDLVPSYSGKWVTEGKKRCPGLVTLGARRYIVHGNMVRGKGEQGSTGSMGITYWMDVTDYDEIKQEYAASRPVVMLLVFDNYDEILRNATDRAKNDMQNLMEDKLAAWTDGKRGLLRRYGRDRYIFICERRYYDQLESAGFTILEDVRSLITSSGMHATLSIGTGCEGASLEENYNFASLSVDMALSRGGDQAVTRNRINFSFYGGSDSEVETRTQVKSRAMATALGSLMKESSSIYIMGHRYADMDTLGAAAGLCCIARKLGKKVRIVMDVENNACGSLLRELRAAREYSDIFVTGREALMAANSRSLLLVVDTNRAEQVESEALLQSVNRVAVIDHHRRASGYIVSAALTLSEQNASSACELVSELMRELVEPKDILSVESLALLAGIVMDTKHFSIRTGERTFEAAAFLRRTGAETDSVKRLLQSDYQATRSRCALIERAELYKEHICISVAEEPVNREIAAQAADELINVSGVEASVVLFPTEDGGVDISARSIGEINVQLLLERMGGGGNKAAAGAQLKNTTTDEVLKLLYEVLDSYLSEK